MGIAYWMHPMYRTTGNYTLRNQIWLRLGFKRKGYFSLVDKNIVREFAIFAKTYVFLRVFARLEYLLDMFSKATIVLALIAK